MPISSRKSARSVTSPATGSDRGAYRSRSGCRSRPPLTLRSAEKRSAVTILVNSFGRPWTEDGFRTSWDKASKRTSLKDLHFHDLRGTAVTWLALSNCSVPEIAAVTGHSTQILDAHHLGGRVELAQSAIKKLSPVYGQAPK
nr:tyrosine-type recombinase/integrase [Bradyrhizobium sp. 199]